MGAVFLDLKKAFDLVDHSVLSSKLKHYVQCDTTCTLISSFLADRTQTVYINGVYSSQTPVLRGVPQGSILGPLLFCIFINDLPLSIQNTSVSCDMFVDDNSIHTSSPNLKQLQNTLQISLNSVTNWCTENSMCLNPVKTKCMVITTRQKQQREPLCLQLTVNGDSIEQVNSHKVLGVTIDEELRWHLHIDKLCRSLSRNLYLLRRLKFLVHDNALKLFYAAHCLSLINYASTLWDGAADTHITRLNSLHRRGVKLIVTIPHLTTDEKLRIGQVLPMKYQLMYNKAVFVYKLRHGLGPEYLNPLLAPAERDNSLNYLLPRTRIDLFKTSFAFAGSAVWNSLPTDVKLCSTLSVFKLRLKQHLWKLCC